MSLALVVYVGYTEGCMKWNSASRSWENFVHDFEEALGM